MGQKMFKVEAMEPQPTPQLGSRVFRADADAVRKSSAVWLNSKDYKNADRLSRDPKKVESDKENKAFNI